MDSFYMISPIVVGIVGLVIAVFLYFERRTVESNGSPVGEDGGTSLRLNIQR